MSDSQLSISSPLKLLREKNKVSRSQLSKLTRLSTYQVEGLEGQSTQTLLSRFFSCTKALGYKMEDVLGAMERTSKGADEEILRGSFVQSVSETNFQEGISFTAYLQTRDVSLGSLRLASGKAIEVRRVCPGDLILAIVREGTFVIDYLLQETVYKKDSFFVFPGNFPVKVCNNDNYVPAIALLYSLKISRP